METLVKYKDAFPQHDDLFVAKFEEHEPDTYSIYAKDEDSELPLLIAKLFCDGTFYLTSQTEVELEFDNLLLLRDFVGGLRIDFALEYEN